MTLSRCSGRVVKVLEAEVGIGQGRPDFCAKIASFEPAIEADPISFLVGLGASFYIN